MATLSDYITKNMDKPLSEKPFNELDYAVLTQLSSIDFEGIVSSGPMKISIEDAYKQFKEEKKSTGSEPLDNLFIKVANSERYKNLKLSHFMQSNNPKTCEQFGAISLDLNLGNKICFFRPTSADIYAWKENFKVVHQVTNATQDRASEYFNRVAMMHPLQRFTLCGHSKGGNNAIYAASNANLVNQARIKKVINFDGPGFNYKKNPGITNKLLLEKVRTFIPQGSVVGRLLTHKEEMTVLKGGKNDEVGQHDLNGWPVGEDEFLRAPKTNYKSDAINKKIMEVFETLDDTNGKLFVDGLFHILSLTGYQKLDDVIANPKSLIRGYFRTDKKERAEVRRVALLALRDKQFMKTVFGKDSKKIAGYGEHLMAEDRKLEAKKPQPKTKAVSEEISMAM